MNRLKLIGQPIVEVEAIGGRSMLAIAIRKGNEEKIQLLTEALKPILIQKLLVAQSATLRLKLRRIDFEILKCLLSDPRMRINDISKIVSVSSKTVSSRLAKLKENRIVMFNVGTNPTKMKGYTRFGMVIWLENDIDKKDIREIHKILENSFVIALLMISQEEVLNYQIVARSIFEIDPILSKLESLAGVRSAEAIIPFKARIHQDWIFQEIENIANNDHKDR
jgi:DNA-binding Lrp family transcriptional regulator